MMYRTAMFTLESKLLHLVKLAIGTFSGAYLYIDAYERNNLNLVFISHVNIMDPTSCKDIG